MWNRRYKETARCGARLGLAHVPDPRLARLAREVVDSRDAQLLGAVPVPGDGDDLAAGADQPPAPVLPLRGLIDVELVAVADAAQDPTVTGISSGCRSVD